MSPACWLPSSTCAIMLFKLKKNWWYNNRGGGGGRKCVARYLRLLLINKAIFIWLWPYFPINVIGSRPLLRDNHGHALHCFRLHVRVHGYLNSSWLLRVSLYPTGHFIHIVDAPKPFWGRRHWFSCHLLLLRVMIIFCVGLCVRVLI